MRLSKIKKWEMLKHLRETAVGIEDGGKTVLKISVDYRGQTGMCAFCGKKHHHGIGDGDRVPHCSFDIFGLPIDKNLIFQNARGELFFQRNGYVLEHVNGR